MRKQRKLAHNTSANGVQWRERWKEPPDSSVHLGWELEFLESFSEIAYAVVGGGGTVPDGINELLSKAP